MESDKIAERVLVVIQWVGCGRKKWIDTVKECLRKNVLDVRQVRKMVQDRCEWHRFVLGNV